MKRLLFTIPDNVAVSLKELVPAGERSKFVIKHIVVPLKELEKNKHKKKATSKYKTQFLKNLAKAERQVKNGEVYTQEEVMRQLGIL
ncbi:hypothetical protein HZC21_06575 [Candidatus Peregrinibacteria bacterium]|nr:hypothetical protein [Candidatus Peregrinibacteria bacterium]